MCSSHGTTFECHGVCLWLRPTRKSRDCNYDHATLFLFFIFEYNLFAALVFGNTVEVDVIILACLHLDTSMCLNGFFFKKQIML